MECKEIINLDLPDLRISEAELTGTKIKYCRVRGIIGSEIKFELRLPESWNSRFVMGGGGGFVGTIQNWHQKKCESECEKLIIKIHNLQLYLSDYQ